MSDRNQKKNSCYGLYMKIYHSLYFSLSIAVVNTSTPVVDSPWKPHPSSSSPDHHWVTNQSPPDPWGALPPKSTSKSAEQPWRSPVRPGTVQNKQNYRYTFTQTMETMFIWHPVCVITKPQQGLTHFPFVRKRNLETNDLTACSALAVRVQQVLLFFFSEPVLRFISVCHVHFSSPWLNPNHHIRGC